MTSVSYRPEVIRAKTISYLIAVNNKRPDICLGVVIATMATWWWELSCLCQQQTLRNRKHFQFRERYIYNQ
jgi:hypothetical protein